MTMAGATVRTGGDLEYYTESESTTVISFELLNFCKSKVITYERLEVLNSAVCSC